MNMNTKEEEQVPAEEPVVDIPEDWKIEDGLCNAQVIKRQEAGKVNAAAQSGTKSVKEIVHENVFTFFNLIFIVLGILLLTAGKFTDMTFLAVALANTLIGIVQEVRSKKAVDKLTILAARSILALRDGKWQDVSSQELVQDDVVRIEEGGQIPADARVLDGLVKVNESLLTGEEDDIEKKKGDVLHSGSVCTSGRCTAVLTAVGNESYAAKLTTEATSNVVMAKSDMMKSLDKLIRVIGFVLVPMGILLFINEFFVLKQGYSSSVQSMVAALVGMIPEGLYLLTSVALAASVLRLSRRRVLVRDLNCVETLARIDTLCVDKTGTITEPGMTVEKLVMLDDTLDEHELRQAVSAYARSFETQNETAKAIMRYFHDDPVWHTEKVVPFSSSIKYSAAEFSDFGRIVVGAPQFVYGPHSKDLEKEMKPYTMQGRRVLLAARYDHELDGGKLDVSKIKPAGLIVIANNIRKNAPETFAYFAEQGVNVKVISGDDPETVSRIASQVNIPNSDKYIDASTLVSDEALAEAMEKYTVFGRTTPDQKKKMVLALQKQKHYVAMTGDGVNDVLALKAADCGIAMASGTEAASQIAQLILLDSDFSAVPSIVLEGRRVINNIERSAQLFLSKNIFSLGLSLLCVFMSLSYPLVPLQLSFISALTIGIPGFFLAMQPNDGRIKGHFLSNVLYYAFPGGICDLLMVGGLNIYGYWFGFSDAEVNTMAVIVALVVGVIILYHACKPLNWFRAGILTLVSVGAAAGIILLPDLLHISILSIQADLIFLLFLLLTYPCMITVQWVLRQLNKAYHWVLQKKETWN